MQAARPLQRLGLRSDVLARLDSSRISTCQDLLNRPVSELVVLLETLSPADVHELLHDVSRQILPQLLTVELHLIT